MAPERYSALSERWTRDDGWIGDPDFNPKLMVPQFIAMTPPKIEKAVEKAIKKAK